MTIHCGDVREILPRLEAESVHCVVTSPPYWGLRDYGCEGQLGLESTPDLYIANMVGVFREVKRVLRADGTLWLNMGDSYASNGTGGNGATGGRDKSTLQSAMPPIGTTPVERHIPAGLKAKDLCGIPWLLAFALRADGWYLRQDIIWSKPNPMPESVTDRCTKAHEYIFLLSKSERYYYNAEAVMEPYARLWDASKPNGSTGRDGWGEGVVLGREKAPHCGMATMEPNPAGRNKRSVWTVTTQPFPEAHFATFPEDLIKPCILAGCPAGGTVLDPFGGSGTTALVARDNNCKAILIELNPAYIEIIKRRLSQDVFQF